MRINKIKNEINKIKKWGKKFNEKILKYKKINIYIIFNKLKQ